jgi:hypothetical protein
VDIWDYRFNAKVEEDIFAGVAESRCIYIAADAGVLRCLLLMYS